MHNFERNNLNSHVFLKYPIYISSLLKSTYSCRSYSLAEPLETRIAKKILNGFYRSKVGINQSALIKKQKDQPPTAGL